MGEVFEAFDPELRRTVAIRLLHECRLPDEEEDARALRLVRASRSSARCCCRRSSRWTRWRRTWGS
ncbi:hypothetical protein [Corallococcus caeni]|uniref:Uncharacterized protein n=1 Tax=Corallococcus caeni TaxID=3082388 RepID=A0ABQ6QUP3_9BACT|nr:hypothetical protein ASNO1_40020 [Corallococcus sp. NO1]